MKKLKLSNSNKEILLDDEDYEKLGQFTYWLRKDGYACRTEHYYEGRKQIAVVICIQWEIMKRQKDRVIDHINRNTLDNRKQNLRICTLSENQINRPKPRNNTTGYKGVVYHKRDKVFRAKIKFNNVEYHIGSFKTAKEAAIAYNNKAKELSLCAFLNEV